MRDDAAHRAAAPNGACKHVCEASILPQGEFISPENI